jgi:hypothetical protein
MQYKPEKNEENQKVICEVQDLEKTELIEPTQEAENLSDDVSEEETVSENNAAADEAYLEAEDAYYNDGIFSDGFDSSFKAYMDYRCITDTASVQYEMQQQAYTDDRGFRRIGDDYCIALGTGFTSGCGERFLITLDSGYSFTAIISDVKSDCHTDSTNCFVPRGENSGNVVEFIIDTDYAESAMLSSGDAGYYDDLSGNIIAVDPI